jgi:hypothetical protein
VDINRYHKYEFRFRGRFGTVQTFGTFKVIIEHNLRLMFIPYVLHVDIHRICITAPSIRTLFQTMEKVINLRCDRPSLVHDGREHPGKTSRSMVHCGPDLGSLHVLKSNRQVTISTSLLRDKTRSVLHAVSVEYNVLCIYQNSSRSRIGLRDWTMSPMQGIHHT